MRHELKEKMSQGLSDETEKAFELLKARFKVKEFDDDDWLAIVNYYHDSIRQTDGNNLWIPQQHN